MAESVYIPFGDFAPDLRYLGNADGLLMAREVVPVYGSYISAPDSPLVATVVASPSVGTERGLHVHLSTGDGYAAVDVAGAPTLGHLYQVTEAGVSTDRSRAAFYTAGNEWHGCSFGDNVVMANGVDPVQFRLGAGAAAFADMITSTFAPVGKFPFSFKNNLFLANLTLAAPYDGLAAGANPTVVAWSRSEDIRQFGSFNANPEILGSGYQPLNFDIGEITGGIGATDYALVAFTNGFVRIEGPPYTFRVIVDNCGTLSPYSLFRAGEDVYFLGPSGLMRLRGGFGPPETIGVGLFTRSLIDNTTGFSDMAWVSGSQIVSGAFDSVNELAVVAYRSGLETVTGVTDPHTQTLLWYNSREERASLSTCPRYDLNDLVAPMHYLRTGRQAAVGSSWSPGRDIRFLSNGMGAAAGTVSYRKFSLGFIPLPLILQRGYRRFHPKLTTRITSVRPIYTTTDPTITPGIWSVSIESVNKPQDAPTVKGPYTSQNTHGSISTPDTVFADFHAPKISVATNSDIYKVVEFRGIEVEFVTGGTFAA